MIKALVVFSGGLDSILAVKVLEEQGIEVTGLSFGSYFFDSQEAKKTARQLEIELITEDISEQQLDTVKNPQYGHGSALNPCIDCHGLMFRVAGELADLVGRGKRFDLIATGEVLGQRPFSQNKEALKKVEKLAGIDILRPLSAKLLPETSYERDGLVNRNKLLDISGKSRQRQLKLVKKYGVKYFPSPAGGCRLTENEFGAKVKQLLENDGQVKKLDKVDFELLRIGRHQWLRQDTRHKTQDTNKFQFPNHKTIFDEQNKKNKQQNKTHVILGKNYEENEQLKKFAKEEDILLESKDLMGPTALIVGFNNLNESEQEQIILEAKKLILSRAKNPGKKKIEQVEWVENIK